MKSFLLIGQSYMAGRGFLRETTAIYNERIQMLRNGRWQMMTEPIHFDRPIAGVGPASSFAEAWCEENKEGIIGLIPCAEGGSAIDEWSPEGAQFRHAVCEAGFAMESSELAGILWHQGESDSRGGKYKEYYGKLAVIVEAIRKELAAPEVPFLIGGLGDYLGKRAFGAGCTEYEKINEELLRFAKENENCCFVTGKGLTANPDGIHINAVSQRVFGLRYFEAYRNRCHICEPLENEAETVERLLGRGHTKAEKTYIALEQFQRAEAEDC